MPQNPYPKGLAIGGHLFFVRPDRSRSKLYTTVSVYIFDPPVPPPEAKSHMVNISKFISETLAHRWSPEKNAVVFNHSNDQDAAENLSKQLGLRLHNNATAFTWEWL